MVGNFRAFPEDRMAAPASSGSSNKLALWILVALVLGALAGLALYYSGIDTAEPVAYLGLVTTMFLRLIKMIIAPLVFATLTVGIAKMGDMAVVGRLGLKAMLWFIAASLMSLGLGLLLVNLFQPGIGLNLPLPEATANSGIAASSMSLADFITHLIPMSIADGMARNEILQIVVFSIFFGIGCAGVGDKARVLVDALEGLSYVMLKVTMLVMGFARSQFCGGGGSNREERSRHLRNVFLFHGRVLPRHRDPVAAAVRRRQRRDRTARDRVVQGGARADPACVRDRLQRSGLSENPGATGKIRLQQPRRGLRAAARLFIQSRWFDDVLHLRGDVHRPAYGIELSAAQQLTMLLVLMVTSKGMAGVPRASLVVIAATLAQFNIPEAGLLLLLGIDHFLDMARSATNVIGNSVATAVVSKWEGQLRSETEVAADLANATSTEASTKA
jgi:Na+/H+-dicarboxylate symporter